MSHADALNCAGFALLSMQGDDGTEGSAYFGVDGFYTDEFGQDFFGWSPFKAVASAVKTVAKVATAPVKAVANTAVGIAKGQNVLQTLKHEGGELAKSTVQAAKIVGNVASFIPGLGTGVSFAIKFTGSVGEAIAAGKNVLNAAKQSAINAALNSLPGGELTGALIKTVANVTAAGVQGQNILKSAAHELVGAAVGLVPNAQAQQVLAAAADAALKGQNVLQGAQAAAINAALAQIPDASARAVVQATLQKKSVGDIVKTAAPSLLSRAAAAIPDGGAATLVTGIVGKNPTQIIVSGPSGINPPTRTKAVSPADQARQAAAKAAQVAAQQRAAQQAAQLAQEQAATRAAEAARQAAAARGAEAARVGQQQAQARAAEQAAAARAAAAEAEGRRRAALLEAEGRAAQLQAEALARAVPHAQPAQAAMLPALAYRSRRISNRFGSRRVTYDLSPEGMIATYVTQ